MIKIYAAENAFDAQLICDALLQAGLQASVKGAGLIGAAGELPVDTLVSVWLFEPMHRERAREIIRTIEQDRNKPASDIACSQCGETSTSQFSHCWQCGSALPFP